LPRREARLGALAAGFARSLARARAARAARTAAQPRLELGRGERAAEEVTLAGVTAGAREEVQLRALLDAFGDDLQPEAARKPDHRGSDRRAAAARFTLRASRADVGDERLVDLEHVDGQVPQVRQAREPGAEIVDRHAHAERAQLREHHA